MKGFKVVCNKCGNIQEFKDGDNRIGDNIEVSENEFCTYSGCQVESIGIYCDNPKCDNYIEI